MQHLRRVSLFAFLAVLLFAARPEHGAGWRTSGREQSASDGRIPGDRAKHLTALGVDRWHRQGHRGNGITVAILDSGFRGHREFFGKGLPNKVTTRSFRADGNLEARDSQHGILCAEIVHAIAPEAKLLLANWDAERPESFLDAISWAKSEGARVVSCSLIMPTWSDGGGGGRIHEELAKVVGAGSGADDILFVACAGNTAQRHWSGTFTPDDDGRHQWSPGKTRNVLTPWGEESVAVEAYGATKAPLELLVLDADSHREVAKSRMESLRVEGRLSLRERCSVAEDSACHSQAAARFTPTPGHTYEVEVQGESAPSNFHVVALGGNLACGNREGSIPFPGDGACVVSVAAIDSEGMRAPYSSCGYKGDRSKPDLAAPVPFPCSCRAQPFSGTSAAAPQVAGLAALWRARHPQATALEARTALHKAAQDLGPPGHDPETGHGQARLP